MKNLPIVLSLALGACTAADDTQTGQTDATVTVDPSSIPADGACTHITATRLSDFTSVEYQGELAGASFGAGLGDYHVTADAYPEPCDSEPTTPPWHADDQIATFTAGDNTLHLAFQADVSVGVDPTFGDEMPIVVRDGSLVRTGRNGEDIAGADLALDGWNVQRIAIPPAAPSVTTLFSLEGKGGADALPYSPRGLAQLPDGRLVAQVSEVDQPLRVFDAAGNYVASFATSYPAGTLHWDYTDGLDVIDATHLVRTGWANTPADDGTYAGLDILQLVAQPDGSTLAVVQQQIRLVGGDYAVGVASLGGGRFAVTTLPTGGTNLTVVDGTGAVLAGPTAIAGDVEGPFLTSDGRIGALDYDGNVTMYDAATAAPRAGETASYPVGVGVANLNSLAWDALADAYVALIDHRLVFASPTFSSVTNLSIDLSSYLAPSGIDYVPGANQLLVTDRIPPVDPTANKRIPRVDVYDLASASLARTVTLQGLPLPLRTRTIAYLPTTNQVASHYVRPGAPVDPTVDAVVFVSNLSDGSLAYRFDLASLGFARVTDVNYLAATDELLITATDISGVSRLVVTDTAGRPRRSYKYDAIDGGIADLAEITSGADAGDLGVATGQPSSFARIAPL